MHSIAFCAVSLLLAAPPAAPKTASDELKAVSKDKYVYLRAPKSGLFAVAMPSSRGISTSFSMADRTTEDFTLFYGVGTTLHHVGIRGRFSNSREKKFEYTLVDPRFVTAPHLNFDQGRFTMFCGEQQTALSVVPDKELSDLLPKLRFVASARQHAPYALARDDQGQYYYVDRGRFDSNENDFRVFRGVRGSMMQAQLTNIVHDSEGDIFSTKDGRLRFILGKSQSWWITSKGQNPLVVVPVDRNLPMIYNELGVYAGQRLGTPCDDM